MDFALEAKCYGPSESVGVRQVSRLISRLRHRQFGILVTTSYLDVYAYKEIKEDQHPILVIAARDIADLVSRQIPHELAAKRVLCNRAVRERFQKLKLETLVVQ